MLLWKKMIFSQLCLVLLCYRNKYVYTVYKYIVYFDKCIYISTYTWKPSGKKKKFSDLELVHVLPLTVSLLVSSNNLSCCAFNALNHTPVNVVTGRRPAFARSSGGSGLQSRPITVKSRVMGPLQYQRSKIHGQPGVVNCPLSGKGPGSFVSRGCSTQKAWIYCGIVATNQQGANEVSAQLNMWGMLIFSTCQDVDLYNLTRPY